MYGGIAGYFPPVNPRPVAAAAPVPPAVPALAAGTLTGGQGPPIPPSPPIQPGGSQVAVTYLRQRLRVIHRHHPNHEMFGPATRGSVVMPLHDQARVNSVCWWNAIDTCCTRTLLRPLQWGRNECWMTKTNSYKINKPDPAGGTILCKSFKAVRLFAFLMLPTDDHWRALRDGDERTPFDHFCGRGESTDPLQLGYVCINGVEHGEFNNRLTNEERKSCKNGAQVLCPGHGANLRKCIFTHPDGRPRPCRNNAGQVPVCACQPRCY